MKFSTVYFPTGNLHLSCTDEWANQSTGKISLLHKDSLDQCSLDELQQYADRYPYFGAAQLLLTKKLQTENTERYQNQLQKTNLFFHNPLWVQQLLNDTGTATIKAV